MEYAEAIEWLREDGYKKDDGTSYEFGEVCLVLLLFKFIISPLNHK
jgi:hypothetical protein